MKTISQAAPSLNRLIRTIALVLLGTGASLPAFDHPGHMTTGAIAFNDVKRERPELIEKLSALLMEHPNRSSFSVAIGDTRGEERGKRLLIYAARWPDDAKFTFWGQAHLAYGPLANPRG